jgi:hypothetical protein
MENVFNIKVIIELFIHLVSMAVYIQLFRIFFLCAFLSLAHHTATRNTNILIKLHIQYNCIGV